MTFENKTDLERVLKNALKISLKINYISYENALTRTGLDCLVERREQLCLKFAKACLRNHNMKDMFPLNKDYQQNTRNKEKYEVTFASKGHLQNSAIPYMHNAEATECKCMNKLTQRRHFG